MIDPHEHYIIKAVVDSQVGSTLTLIYITYASMQAYKRNGVYTVDEKKKMVLVVKPRSKNKIPEEIKGTSLLYIIELLGTKEALQKYKTECLLIT